ncbi:putative Oil body-associated protein [Helianthus annuus]|nr:putative Oil body-associated protein [Helianthus annuus]
MRLKMLYVKKMLSANDTCASTSTAQSHIIAKKCSVSTFRSVMELSAGGDKSSGFSIDMRRMSRINENARLIGLEYIVTEELFLTLPDTEKPMWHSHEYELKSGVLFLPGPVEQKDLEKVAKTYGKTIHFW